MRIEFAPGSVQPTAGADLHRAPFTERAVLSDGGIYDNLGLERVWKRCRTVLVSNAGKTVPELGSPTGRWIGQTLRTLNLVQQQAENSRRRILFGMSNLDQRKVAYWSIETPIEAYGVCDAVVIAASAVAEAAMMRTRLNAFSSRGSRSLAVSWVCRRRRRSALTQLATNAPPAQLPVASNLT